MCFKFQMDGTKLFKRNRFAIPETTLTKRIENVITSKAFTLTSITSPEHQLTVHRTHENNAESIVWVYVCICELYPKFIYLHVIN